MQLAVIAETWRDVGDVSARNAKVDRLRQCLRQAGPDEVGVVASWLAGVLPQGRIGVGHKTVRAVHDAAAPEPSLTVVEVHRRLTEIAETTGRGSKRRREELLGGLLRRATPLEQDFLTRLVLGYLRQGASEGIVVSAIAKAFGVKVREVRRALMFSADLGAVAAAAGGGGSAALADFSLDDFREPLVGGRGADE